MDAELCGSAVLAASEPPGDDDFTTLFHHVITVPMSLREPKTAGMITCMLGLFMAWGGVIGLAVVNGQRAIRASYQPHSDPDIFLDAMHRIWLFHLPIFIVGGVVLFICGLQVRRSSRTARRICQFCAVIGYAWVLLYAIHSYELSPLVLSSIEVVPESAREVVFWIGIIASAAFNALFPTALLYMHSGGEMEQLTREPQEAA